MDDIVSQIQSDDTLVEKLPCRLELMGYKQCSIWITNQILLNHKEQGKHGSKICYGEDEWHPSFWLDDIFPWSSMRCNFNNLKAIDYTGENNLVWFMKRLISERLSMKGIYDPNLHVSKVMSEDEVIRKERRRGIHRPSVIRQAANQNVDNEENDDDGVNDDDDVNGGNDDVNENSPELHDSDGASVDQNNSIHNESDPPGISSLPSRLASPPSSAGAPPSTIFSTSGSPPPRMTPRRKRPSQLVETQEPSASSEPASPPPHPLPSRRRPQPPPLPPRVGQGVPRQLPPRFPEARRSVIQEPESLPPKRARRPVTCSTCSSPNCSDHPSTSQPRRQDQRVRKLILPGNLVDRFKSMSMQNTIMRKETGGLLFGELKDGDFLVNVLVLPKQAGGADFWKTTDEAQLGKFSADNPALTLVGTIHTHPGFDSTPSSVDLHQQYDLQVQQPSAIAVIVAPERNQSPFYTITTYGMNVLRDCTADRTIDNGFHLHRSIRKLYNIASNVIVDPNLHLDEVDQRFGTQFQNL